LGRRRIYRSLFRIDVESHTDAHSYTDTDTDTDPHSNSDSHTDRELQHG